MEPRTRLFVFLVSTPLVGLVTIGGLIGAPIAAPQQSFSTLRVWEDVVSLVTHAYVEPVDVDRIMDGSMRGLVEGLDSSSAFLLPDEVKAIAEGQPVPEGDPGLFVTRQFYLRVLGVRDGSPAARAGLPTGDYVRMIDDKPTRDLSTLAGQRLLRGAPGTKVKLTIIRGSVADPHEFELVREAPNGPAVTSSVEGNVATVRISSFAAGTTEALGGVFDKLAASRVSGAVIDLRGVADGAPEEGANAARLFVKTGPLAVRAGRTGSPLRIEAAAGDGRITMPLVLLVSNGTAHAAEVFAGALSGHKRAELVGEPTAGIAAVQRLIRLPQGYGIWLTHQRFMTVDGATPIHEAGLTPALAIAMPLVGFDEVPPATDAPLARAIERLKSAR